MTTTNTMTSAAALATGTLPIPSEGKPALQIKRNAPALPTDATIRGQVSLAMAHDDKSKGYDGTATQRMAFAVLAEHATLVEGGKELPSLATTLASAEARKLIKRELTGVFNPKPKKFEASIEGGKSRLNYNALNTRLDRGIEFAALCDKHGVDFTAFDLKLGMFKLPVSMFMPTGATPFPDSLLATQLAIPVMRQDVAYFVKNKEGKSIHQPKKASVDHIFFVGRGPAKERQSSEASGDVAKPIDAVKRMSADALSKVLSVGKMIAVLHGIIASKDAAPLMLEDLTVKERNMLAEIMMRYDHANKIWHNKREAMKAEDKKAADKASAMTGKLAKATAKKAA